MNISITIYYAMHPLYFVTEYVTLEKSISEMFKSFFIIL